MDKFMKNRYKIMLYMLLSLLFASVSVCLAQGDPLNLDVSENEDLGRR